MKLTRAASYALQAVVHIAGKAKRKESTTVASHEIAEQLDIPDRFLLKVLKPLVNHEILQSVKGPSGGYSLAKPANEITMLEVLESVEGGIRGHAPLNSIALDPKEPKVRTSVDFPLRKRLEEICNQVSEQARKQLSKVKISDLASRQ